MSNEENSGSDERERRSATILWLRLARVFQKIDRRAVAELRCQDLSVAQFDVLAQIGAHEGLSQQELANYLLVTKGNISQLVEKMEQRGLVRRSAEGRIMRLWLTQQGQTLYAGSIPAYEDMMVGQFTSLDQEEQRQLRALLTRLDHSL